MKLNNPFRALRNSVLFNVPVSTSVRLAHSSVGGGIAFKSLFSRPYKMSKMSLWYLT